MQPSARIPAISCGCLAVLAAVWCSPLSADDKALLQEFEREAPVAWRTYVDRFDRNTVIRCEQTTRGRLLPDGEEGSEKISVEVVRSNGMFVSRLALSGRDLSEAPQETRDRYAAASVSGFNGKYGFSILDYERKGDWVIEYVGAEKGGKGLVLAISGGAVHLPGLEIPFTCLEPSAGYAHARSASNFETDSGSLVEVEFDYTGKVYTEDVGTGKPLRRELKGVSELMVRFDRELSWLPVFARVRHQLGGVEHVADSTWAYENSSDGPIGPESYVRNYASPQHEARLAARFEYEQTPMPEGRFHLTHYGLPEPRLAGVAAGGQGGRSLLYWVLGVNGILLVLAGTYFQRRLRKRNTAAAE